MNNLVDIIQNVINNINLNINVINIVDGKTITVCDTKHITINKIVKNFNKYGSSGLKYKVISFVEDTTVVVEPYGHSVPFAGSKLIAPEITFLHGSPSSVNNEYAQVDQQTLNKTPFIWLLEPYDENLGESDSALEVSFDCRLFFMDWAYNQGWKNDEHDTNVIKPMKKLLEQFNGVIYNDFSFRNTSVIRSRPRSRFGVVVTNRGSDRTIINEDLSGLEVEAELDLFDVEICNC